MDERTAINRIAFVLYFVCCLVIFSRAFLGDWGTNDFIEYWAAHQLWMEGKDPYSVASILSIQRKLGWTGADPQMMWNPPWLLTILSPVLGFSCLTSAAIWLLLNLLLLTLNVVLLSKLYRLESFLGVMLLLSLFFYPTLCSLHLGQTGLLIGLGSTLLLWGLVHRVDSLIALALILLSVKPHLLYLVMIAVLWQIVREKRWKIFLYTGALLLLLVTATETILPGSLNYWLTGLKVHGDTPGITEWRAVTLGHFLAAATGMTTKGSLVFIISILAGLASVFLLLWLKKNKSIQWLQFYPPLAAVSLATAPYGWVFDQTVLLPISAFLLSEAVHSDSSRYRRSNLTLLTAFHSLTVVAGCLIVYAHYFVWHAPLALGVWFLGRKLRKDKVQQESQLLYTPQGEPPSPNRL